VGKVILERAFIKKITERGATRETTTTTTSAAPATMTLTEAAADPARGMSQAMPRS